MGAVGIGTDTVKMVLPAYAVKHKKLSAGHKNRKEFLDMKKSKLLLGGVLALTLVVGMMAVGCDNGTTSNTDPKTITITGLTGKTGEVEFIVSSTPDDVDAVAAGVGTINNNSVTIALVELPYGSGNVWTGTGSYYLMMEVDSFYWYSNGLTFEALGISGESDISKLPKFSIEEAASTIGFDRFIDSDLLEDW
ncbi:MAG: hypothetical protein LBQ35_06295 [Spirochaetaceae bacterium]|jgi:hypothetical protein|nr:hypothetical protein [Spirochaetaceae bacterium]